jgi:hypothetical protein
MGHLQNGGSAQTKRGCSWVSHVFLWRADQRVFLLIFCKLLVGELRPLAPPWLRAWVEWLVSLSNGLLILVYWVLKADVGGEWTKEVS